jgi:hypothetical protein
MLCFGEFLQPVESEFPADPALLVSAEWSAFVQEMPFVDPDRACAARRAPEAPARAHVASVSPLKGLSELNVRFSSPSTN